MPRTKSSVPWRLTAICTSSSKGPDALFWLLLAQSVIYLTCTYMPVKHLFKKSQMELGLAMQSYNPSYWYNKIRVGLGHKVICTRLACIISWDYLKIRRTYWEYIAQGECLCPRLQYLKKVRTARVPLAASLVSLAMAYKSSVGVCISHLPTMLGIALFFSLLCWGGFKLVTLLSYPPKCCNFTNVLYCLWLQPIEHHGYFSTFHCLWFQCLFFFYFFKNKHCLGRTIRSYIVSSNSDKFLGTFDWLHQNMDNRR